MEQNSPTILVAGASGYIGMALLTRLLEKFPNAKVVALSRSLQKSSDPRINWKACDLFSLKSIEEAVPAETDLAFYLVHSMGPTAHLDQGSFADYDLILADNFSRAVKKTKIQQLIYLGGLIPETKTLSLHLQSRLEVEEVFAQFQLPITVLRAGLILGQAGSSFQILLKLVKRLPFMVCPRWTQTLTTPVDLATVIHSLCTVAFEGKHLGKVYDLAGCKPITYLEMMKETSKIVGKKRFFFSVPFFTPTLSRLWVSLITNTSKDLVYPLIESLEHAMLARPQNLLSHNHLNTTYADLLKVIPLKTVGGVRLFQFRAPQKSVRSVQRLPLPHGKNAEWVMNQYLDWLPRFLNPLVKVRKKEASLALSAFASRPVLLELKTNSIRSNPDRQLLNIMNGILVGEENHGRLEFRVVLNRRYVLAAIHEFRPALPWFFYIFTQAPLHLLVMRSFGKYLSKL